MSTPKTENTENQTIDFARSVEVLNAIRQELEAEDEGDDETDDTEGDDETV